MKNPAKYPELNGDEMLMANKEKWLGHIATEFNEYFVNAGHPLPKLRAVCGFTSNGAGQPGAKKVVIGQCWYPQNGDEDRHVEIFVSPTLDEIGVVTATLAHELCHAALGQGFGHGKEFGALARGLNLEGSLTATTAGPRFLEMIDGFVSKVGEMPEGKLDISGMKPAHPKNRKPQSKKSTLKCQKTDCDIELIMKNNLIESNPRVKCPIHGGELSTKPELTEMGL